MEKLELYERIRSLVKSKGISLTKLAEMLDLPQPTFQKWLTPATQKHLYDHLPKILELFPDIRIEWLYIGQEPMHKDEIQAKEIPTREEFDRLKAENERLRLELLEADRLNRKLTARILVGDDIGKDSAKGLEETKVGEK